MPLSSWMNQIARLVRCNRGSASPEYAILTLALIGVAIPAIGSLGQLVGHVFSDVQLASDSAVVSTITPTVVTPTASPAATIPEVISTWTGRANALAFVVAAIAMTWLFLRKNSSKDIATPRPLAEGSRETACLTGVEKRQQIVKRLCRETAPLLQGDLEIRFLMTIAPVTVGPRTSVEQAREIMEQHRMDYLLVCDADEKLLGLLSRYYLQRTSVKRVTDAMLPNPLFVSPNAMLSPTVTHMLNKGVSCVAVVEHDRAIGMVTTTDIQLTFQAALQVLAKATSEQRLADPNPDMTPEPTPLSSCC